MELVSHNNRIPKNLFVYIIAIGVISIHSCDTESKNPGSATTAKDTSRPVEIK